MKEFFLVYLSKFMLMQAEYLLKYCYCKGLNDCDVKICCMKWQQSRNGKVKVSKYLALVNNVKIMSLTEYLKKV